jgi:4-phosphopantoate--beta-alanine ligase
MIPEDHPRYTSLVTREHLAECARTGIVSLEGLTAHGRGEAFDYLLGEKTTDSALKAAKTAAAFLFTAKKPVFSVNGNTAALAASLIADLQRVSRIDVEVNLFHRTEERMEKITRFLEAAGVRVMKGTVERLVPLSHDRALCLRDGIISADVVIVPLEDGDRCEALKKMGKIVITVDLNPLSRTSRTADLTIVDEVTRAIPHISRFYEYMTLKEADGLISCHENRIYLKAALDHIAGRLKYALD